MLHCLGGLIAGCLIRRDQRTVLQHRQFVVARVKDVARLILKLGFGPESDLEDMEALVHKDPVPEGRSVSAGNT